MTWLVRRRQRIPLLVALGLVVLVAALTWGGQFGWLASAAAAGVEPCLRGADADVCDSDAWLRWADGFRLYYSLVALAVVALPGVAGALAGAGLFGSEMARGTHVFALSQSVSRLRWFGTGLLVAGMPVALAVAASTPLTAAWAEPFGNAAGQSLMRADGFLTSGLVPAAYTLLAFCVAAAAGLLLRSTVGALGLALALQVTVLFVASFMLRPAYLPPERLVVPSTGVGASFVDTTGPDDLYVASGYVDAAGRPVDVVGLSCMSADDWVACLENDYGIVGNYTSFQPASRYWPFQAIESGILLALAGVALGAGLWGLRRRVH